MRIKEFVSLFLELSFNCFPTINNLVVFYSFDGQYNDNPKYISECLHESDRTVQIAWILNKNTIGTQPEYVIPLKKGSVKALLFSSLAHVYVDNYTGKRTIRKRRKISKLCKLLKNKHQFNISTWHGTPLKKIHNDIEGYQCFKDSCFTTCDLFVSGNKYLRNIIERSLPGQLNFLEVGSPRNDILLNYTAENVNQIREKMHIPDGKKVVLFAPTFRDNLLDSGVNQLESIDVKSLLNELSRKFGGDWTFAYRFHPSLSQKIKYDMTELENKGVIVDANCIPEMAECLIASDILVTDYSGSLFDYCILKRPCFLYAHDLEYYSQHERGLYLDIHKLPFTFSTSFEELISNIRSFNEEKLLFKIDNFLDYIGNNETGTSSESVVEIILQKVYESKDIK